MRGIKKSSFAKSEAGLTSSKEPLVPPLKDGTWKLVVNALLGVFILVVVVLLPCILYMSVFADTSGPKSDSSTCMILPEYRVRCGKAVNKAECEALGCCWNITECFHSLPSQHGYSVSDWSGSDSLDKSGVLNLIVRSQLQTPVGTAKKRTLTITAKAISPHHLRLQLSESNPMSTFVGRALINSKFRAVVEGPEFFSLQILRREGSQTLFSTALGPIIASEDYWEITLYLPKQGAIFGLGTLELGATQSVVKTLYNREDQPDAQPFLLYLDERGRAHGILIHTAGPLEAEIMPANLLILRAIYPWDISVFAGPTPEDVYSQMTSAITVPAVPQPWAFGLHVCRDTDDWLKEMEKFMKNALELGLPYESDCIHERLVTQNLNFTVPIEAQEAFVTIRNAGKRLMLSLPPHVSPDLAETYSEIMVQKENEWKPLREDFDGRLVCYLDVEHPNASSWLKDQLARLNIPADFQISGYVLQDNWPAVSTYSVLPREDLPYIPQALNNSLSNGTLWWKVRHYGGVAHVQVHNDYGKSHANSIFLMDPKALVLSASTSTGTGSICGSHRQRNVHATWLDMKQAFHTLLALSLAGIPMASGGPVCGSEPGEFDEHLCIKWYWLNSLLPLMRVSSSVPLRDPTNLKTLTAQKSATKAVRFRYSLLPYFIWISHLGSPIARPMFFDWPEDSMTWSLDEQFMLGPALLARPVFTSQLVNMQVFLPGHDSWYHFQSGVLVSPDNGSIANVVDFDDIAVFIRGGYIVPTQDPQTTVKKTLAGNYTFVVAFSKNSIARGELYHHLEDNSYLIYQLEANKTTLRVQYTSGGCSQSLVLLDTILLYGVFLHNGAPRVISGDSCILGHAAAIEPVISTDRHVTRIVHLALDLCCSGPLGQIFLEWT